MRLTETKVGEPLVIVGNIEELGVPVADLTLWNIRARARRGTQSWDFLRNVAVQPNSYSLSLDTTLITPGDIEFDVRFTPPGGAAFFSETFIAPIVAGKTP